MEHAIVGRRGAARWKRGHPWIYRSDVVQPPGGAAGAVHVSDERGTPLGVALWSPASVISLRMLDSDAAPEGSFWRERIAASVRFRRSLGLPPDTAEGAGSPPASDRRETTAFRVVHAEADRLPSLIVDRYGPYLSIQLLSAGLEAHREEIVEALAEVLRPAGILARNDVPIRDHENLPRATEILTGTVPDEVEVLEHGIPYLVDLRSGQKTGAFLDQRENRGRAAGLARGRVLDCFAYQGAFALQVAAGADHVVAVDSSSDALALARRNATLTGLDTLLTTIEANAFDHLRRCEEEGERYDLVILDPPAFAKSRGAIEGAVRGYKEINLRALRILRPGGHLCTFSCSYHMGRDRFRAMLADAAADSGRPVRWIEERGQSSDHPEILQIPESGYLKGAILQVA